MVKCNLVYKKRRIRLFFHKYKEYSLVLLITMIAVLLSTLPTVLFSFVGSALTTALLAFTITQMPIVFAALQTCFVLLVYTLFQGNFTVAFVATIQIALCGFSMGICYNLKQSTFKLLGITTMVHASNLIATITTVKGNNQGQDFFANLISGQMYNELQAFSSVYPIPEAELNKFVSELTSLLMKLSPALILIACLLTALLGYYLFHKIILLKKADTSIFIPFDKWKVEKSISFTFIVLFIIYSAMPKNILITDVFFNIIVVMTFVYFIFGLSSINLWLKKRITNKILRRLLLFFVLTTSMTISGVVFLFIGALGIINSLSKPKQTH